MKVGTTNQIVVAPPPPVTVTTTSLPAATVGTAYTTSMSASGGVPPYTWTATGVPGGLTLTTAGVLSGTPTTAATNTINFTATDSASTASPVKSLTLTIGAAGSVVVTTTALPSVAYGATYSTTLAASGGTPPYTWVVAGLLPYGMTYSGTTGVISGTASSVGSYPLTVTATDSTSSASPATPLTLTVSATSASALSIIPSIPGAFVGIAYSAWITGLGGTQPYTVAVTGAPAWMTINPDGSVSGTPTSAGTVSLSVQLTDFASTTVSGTVTCAVGATGSTWFGAMLPIQPTMFTTTSSPPAAASTNRGSYYTPGVGADSAMDFQTALNNAAAATGTLGDVIVLQAGSTYTTTSTFLLPARTGSGWIYIISSQAPEIGGTGLAAAGTRVKRADTVHMGALRTSSMTSYVLFRAATAGVNYYRFVGIDIQLPDGNSNNNTILLGVSDSSLSTLCQHITFDRCYMAGGLNSGAKSVITPDGNYMEVTECCIERGWSSGSADTHAIALGNSTGPYRFHNNWMEAGGENFMTGGGDTKLPPVAIPSDIELTGNHIYKPIYTATADLTAGSTTINVTALTAGSEIVATQQIYSAGGAWTSGQPLIVSQLTGTPRGIGTYKVSVAPQNNVPGDTINGYIWSLGKNAFELKCGLRVLIDRNCFLNAFAGGQSRTAMVLTSRNQNGSNPWYCLDDITVSNNLFTNCFNGAMQLLLQDTNAQGGWASQASYRILYRNNLFLISRLWNFGSTTVADGLTSIISISSNLAPIGSGNGKGGSIVYDHNTFVGPVVGSIYNVASIGGANNVVMPVSNVVWSNNIWDPAYYPFQRGGSPGYTYATSMAQLVQPRFTNNVLTANADGTVPADNFKPANVAAVGYTAYGSITAAPGYALLSSSTYHAAGVSGAGIAYNGTGTADGTDLGCNVSVLTAPTTA